MSEIRPSFIAFLISFVVVAISWAGHRDLFAHIRRTDSPLVWPLAPIGLVSSVTEKPENKERTGVSSLIQRPKECGAT